MLFVDPRRRFTVNNKNNPYEINKAVRMQSTIFTEFDMVGSNDDILLVRCVSFVILVILFFTILSLVVILL